MSADPIIYCLEHLTDYRQFERLCSDLMAGLGYVNIDPIGGTNDRGRDALHRSRSADDLTIFAYTVRSDWRQKLAHDCNRINDEKHNPQNVVFVCTSTLSGTDKDEARASAFSRYGWHLELYDLERLRVLLVGNLRHLVAQHPAIFCPPWFPQRGGLSVAEAADTLIIDHVAADHALATWLARRLSLEGYRTWCYGTAPLAGENADDSVRLLIQKRALQYLPVLSTIALDDRDFMDRCGAAGVRDELLLPCWSSPLEDLLQGSRLGRVRAARFDEFWSFGLRDVIERLKSIGITPSQESERGRSIALRAYVPEAVTTPTPERVFANVFRTTVPASIFICELERPLTADEAVALRQSWAFVAANQQTLLAFEEPPAGIPMSRGQRLPEYAWESYEEREGKNSVNVVKELVKRSLDVACIKSGLQWCDDRRVFYFPLSGTKQTNLSFRHVDGRNTHVAANGDRQYGWGERASKFHYQLGPTFRVGRDEAGAWWVTVRIYVRVTDTTGAPFQLKDITRRRKAVTKNWWNKEWLARLLGIMQALRTVGNDICIGSGRRAVTVSSVPLEWHCPISIDVVALERIGDFQEEMAAMRYVDEEAHDEEEQSAEGDEP